MAALSMWRSSDPAPADVDSDALALSLRGAREAAIAAEERIGRRLDAEREERAAAIEGLWRGLERQQRSLAELGAAVPASTRTGTGVGKEVRELFASVAALHGDVEAVRATVRAAFEGGVAPRAHVESLEAAVVELRAELADERRAREQGAVTQRGLDKVTSQMRALESELGKGVARCEAQVRQLDERLAATDQRQRTDAKNVAQEITKLQSLEQSLRRVVDRTRVADEAVTNIASTLRKEADALKKEFRAELTSRSAALRAELDGFRQGELPDLVKTAVMPHMQRLEEDVRRKRHADTQEAMQAERASLSQALAHARAEFANLVESRVSTECGRLRAHLVAEVSEVDRRAGEAAEAAKTARRLHGEISGMEAGLQRAETMSRDHEVRLAEVAPALEALRAELAGEAAGLRRAFTDAIAAERRARREADGRALRALGAAARGDGGGGDAVARVAEAAEAAAAEVTADEEGVAKDGDGEKRHSFLASYFG